ANLSGCGSLAATLDELTGSYPPCQCCFDQLERRLVVIGAVHARAHVLHQKDAEITIERLEARAQNTVVRVDSSNDQGVDSQVLKQELHVGIVERAVAVLEHRMLTRAWSK